MMNSDRFIKQAIVGAVILGWLISIVVDCYLSIVAGNLSATLQDVIKQGLAALVGFLAKTGIEAFSGESPMPVTNAQGQPLKTEDVTGENSPEAKPTQ